jgi:methionyl-tRNA synthetase
MALAGAANAFVEEQAPWKLAKQPERTADLDAVLASLARTLARLAVLLSPFMPAKSRELWGALGLDGPVAQLSEYEKLDPGGKNVQRQAVLFPKIES